MRLSAIKGANIRFNFDTSLPENVLALDITNPADPQQLSIIEDQKIEVVLNNNNLSRFIIVDNNNIPSINEIDYNSGIVFNSLRNENITADYIIIGPENYFNAAQPILDLRNPSIYASLENIYREFSKWRHVVSIYNRCTKMEESIMG